MKREERNFYRCEWVYSMWAKWPRRCMLFGCLNRGMWLVVFYESQLLLDKRFS